MENVVDLFCVSRVAEEISQADFPAIHGYVAVIDGEEKNDIRV